MTIETHKNYWLHISPDTYCCIKPSRALLYNTQTGTHIVTENSDILQLLCQLHERKNLGSIPCEGKIIGKTPYKEFITEFCKKSMGQLTDISEMPAKPVQMMPLLNLQRDVEKLPATEEFDKGDNILRYLQKLNIYLNNSCNQQCPLCNYYYRQCHCCTKATSDTPQQLSPSNLRYLFEQIKHGFVAEINLLGSDIFQYLQLKEIKAFSLEFRGHIHVWNHYRNVSTPTFFSCYNDLIITFPVDEKVFNECLHFNSKPHTKYHFYITNETEYQIAESLIEKNNIIHYLFHPIYTGNNLDFFKNYVYADQEDVLAVKLPFYRIFAHQKLNTSFFGALTIFPNGNIYADIHKEALGNITDTCLLDIIHKELQINTAWRRIRNSAPCCNCIYQYICPSPSYYETVTGIPNLCHIT